MEASWTENTDKTSCLCCGQRVNFPLRGGPERWGGQLMLLPGMAEWLQGQ